MGNNSRHRKSSHSPLLQVFLNLPSPCSYCLIMMSMAKTGTFPDLASRIKQHQMLCLRRANQAVPRTTFRHNNAKHLRLSLHRDCYGKASLNPHWIENVEDKVRSSRERRRWPKEADTSCLRPLQAEKSEGTSRQSTWITGAFDLPLSAFER